MGEIGRQLVKAPLAAAISPYLISPTHPPMYAYNHPYNNLGPEGCLMWCTTRVRTTRSKILFFIFRASGPSTGHISRDTRIQICRQQFFGSMHHCLWQGQKIYRSLSSHYAKKRYQKYSQSTILMARIPLATTLWLRRLHPPYPFGHWLPLHPKCMIISSSTPAQSHTEEALTKLKRGLLKFGIVLYQRKKLGGVTTVFVEFKLHKSEL